MTTERSGMSLEQVRDALRSSELMYGEFPLLLANAIDHHLSLAREVSTNDAVENVCQLAASTYDPKGDDNIVRHFVRTAISSFAARQVSVPPGYVLAPVEPTKKMLDAGSYELSSPQKLAQAYKAMLAQRDGG